jgi:tRNA threonylcarbamoyladenosine biosynthesis protein TsaB
MLLALDTATRSISLALHDGQSVIAEHTWRTADHHTVELAPTAALLLRRAGVEPRQLSGLAVALGPGSYTGLRIGLGFAKGLALAHNTPLVGVPTFEILLRAIEPRAEAVLAIIPAGRGRISAAQYRWQGEWIADGPTRLTDWNAVAADIHEPTFICGEVDDAGRAALRQCKPLVTLASPAQSLRRASYLAEIGWERLRQPTVAASVLAPIYGGSPEGSAA